MQLACRHAECAGINQYLAACFPILSAPSPASRVVTGLSAPQSSQVQGTECRSKFQRQCAQTLKKYSLSTYSTLLRLLTCVEHSKRVSAGNRIAFLIALEHLAEGDHIAWYTLTLAVILPGMSISKRCILRCLATSSPCPMSYQHT